MTLNPWAWVQAMIDKTRHPVGYIFEWDDTGLDGAPDLTTPEKVAAYFGYGVWARYGDGRVTVGAVDGKYVAGATGGEEKNTLSVEEIPSHGHKINNMSWGGKNLNHEVDKDSNFWVFDTNNTEKIDESYIEYTGGSQPHNNMQPYVVVYRWRRIA